MFKRNNLVQNELEGLRSDDHFDGLDKGLLLLVATLRLHGFFVLRADDAKDVVGVNDDLSAEMSHPSVWLQSRQRAALIDKIRAAQPGGSDHSDLNNHLVRAELLEQKKLLALLEEFYQGHTADFYVRLIVCNAEQGGFYLKSQAADSSVLMDGPARHQWLEQSHAEMRAFGRLLAEKL